MTGQTVKLKYEDLVKTCEYLQKNCPGGYVYILMEQNKVIVKATAVNQSHHSVILYDDAAYMLPRLVKEDSL